MSASDSKSRGKKRRRESSETEEVFNSVYDLFVNFMDKAEAIVSKKQQIGRHIAPAPKRVYDDEEHGGSDKARKAFCEHPSGQKKVVLKKLWEEIAGNLLESLPEEGKEGLLVRCFHGLYQKLPEESRKLIDATLESFGVDAEPIVRASETRGKSSKGEASESKDVCDSVFDMFMDFTDKAKAIVSKQQTRLTAPAPNGVHDEEHRGLDNAQEAFDKLPPDNEEELLKQLWGENAGNLLERLPEEGKEAFLVRCFDMLYQKLPEESRLLIDKKFGIVHFVFVPHSADISSASRRAHVNSASLSRTRDSAVFRIGSRRDDSANFCTKVHYPPTVGRPRKPNPPPLPNPQPNPLPNPQPDPSLSPSHG